MAVTSLRRKKRRNRIVSKKRVAGIKRLTATPVIKKVIVEDGKVTEGIEASKPGIDGTAAPEAKADKVENIEAKAEKKEKKKVETPAEDSESDN